MEVLEQKNKCLELEKELIYNIEAMNELEIIMNNTEKYSIEFQKLYEDEFRLAMEITDLFEDLHLNLKRLEQNNPEYVFFCNGIRKNIDNLVKLEIIMEE